MVFVKKRRGRFSLRAFLATIAKIVVQRTGREWGDAPQITIRYKDRASGEVYAVERYYLAPEGYIRVYEDDTTVDEDLFVPDKDDWDEDLAEEIAENLKRIDDWTEEEDTEIEIEYNHGDAEDVVEELVKLLRKKLPSVKIIVKRR